MQSDNIKKKEFLIRKNQCKNHIDEYIGELNALCNITVKSEDLLSLVETDRIIGKFSGSPKKILKEIDFGMKQILEKLLIPLSNQKVLLVTEYSKFCGGLKLESASDFNFDFSYNDEHCGFISFYSLDSKNRIILDFYEEHNMKQIDIEVEGDYWVSLIKTK